MIGKGCDRGANIRCNVFDGVRGTPSSSIEPWSNISCAVPTNTTESPGCSSRTRVSIDCLVTKTASSSERENEDWPSTGMKMFPEIVGVLKFIRDLSKSGK